MNEKYNMDYQGGIDISLAGFYRLQVLNATTKELMTDYGWNKNLILNGGMDAIASSYVSSLNLSGICGTGSRPNYITSSTQQITQSGHYIGLSDFSYLTSFTQSWYDTNGSWSYASAVQPGDLIIDQDLSQSTVVLVSGSYMYVTGSNLTYVTPKTFTIWKTSQTRLQYEVHRSNTYLQGSSSLLGWNCGSTVSSSTMVNRRTYDFPVEVQSRSYTEVGCTWTNTANAGVFSRAVLPQTVSLGPNQQLRMTYDIMATYGPFQPVYKSVTITGWPVLPSTSMMGTESLQCFMPSSVTTAGGDNGIAAYSLVGTEPAAWNYGLSPGYVYHFSIYVSDTSASLYTGSVSINGAVGRNPIGNYSIGAATFGPYVAGTYTLTKTATIDIYNGNSANIRSMGFGCVVNPNLYGEYTHPWDTSAQVMTFIFDQPQTKTALQTLTLAWRWNWSRVIQ